MASTELPDKDSSDLRLVQATPEEILAQQHANSDAWKGPLSLEDYLRREQHLSEQELTKDGGLTSWLLVYQPPGTETRQVLCGCESIKKKALLAHNGEVEDRVAHSVCSVFSPREHRGKGYAGRMMSEVGKRLRNFQVSEWSKNSAFSVLFSDIGKDFYAARGWQPFPSAHISLPATSTPSRTTQLPVQPLQKPDASDLCGLDEQLIRNRLLKRTSSGSTKSSVALIPDERTLAWHWAREDFVSSEHNNGKKATFMDLGRGAVTELDGRAAGKKVWIWWTRVWTNPAENAPNTLHILRLGVEHERYDDFGAANEDEAFACRDYALPQAIARLLARAQKVAKESGMDEVSIWNPTSSTLAAARVLEEGVKVVQRERESICSLLWYEEGDWRDVEWVCNEKFGWC